MKMLILSLFLILSGCDVQSNHESNNKLFSQFVPAPSVVNVTITLTCIKDYEYVVATYQNVSVSITPMVQDYMGKMGPVKCNG